jgi:hypothetical protein
MTRGQTLLLSMSILTLSCSIMTTSFGLSPNTAFLTLSPTSPAIQIHYGETIAGGLEALGDYEFLGKAGDVVVIQMVATTFTPVLILHNVDGSAAASDDGADYPVAVIGPLALRQDGAYRVFSGRREAVTQGSFTLRLEQVEPQAIAYGDTVEVEFAENESARYFRFDAGILDVVSITVTGDGALDTRLRMRELTDSYDFAIDDDSGETQSAVPDLRIPYTNQYLSRWNTTSAQQDRGPDAARPGHYLTGRRLTDLHTQQCPFTGAAAFRGESR